MGEPSPVGEAIGLTVGFGMVGVLFPVLELQLQNMNMIRRKAKCGKNFFIKLTSLYGILYQKAFKAIFSVTLPGPTSRVSMTLKGCTEPVKHIRHPELL
jgi:hypothetical protein